MADGDATLSVPHCTYPGPQEPPLAIFCPISTLSVNLDCARASATRGIGVVTLGVGAAERMRSRWNAPIAARGAVVFGQDTTPRTRHICQRALRWKLQARGAQRRDTANMIATVTQVAAHWPTEGMTPRVLQGTPSPMVFLKPVKAMETLTP